MATPGSVSETSRRPVAKAPNDLRVRIDVDHVAESPRDQESDCNCGGDAQDRYDKRTKNDLAVAEANTEGDAHDGEHEWGDDHGTDHGCNGVCQQPASGNRGGEDQEAEKPR